VRRKWVLVTVATVVVAALLLATFFLFRQNRTSRGIQTAAATPEAPTDLQKLRDDFARGLAALQSNDGAAATAALSSFTFGPRAVEEYRLYYLANAHRLSGNDGAARATLVRLWDRNPRLAYADEVGFSLAGLHTVAGSWRQAAGVLNALAARPTTPEVSAAARWQEAESHLATGNVGGALAAARLIVIRTPKTPQAEDAIGLLRSMLSLPDAAAIPLNVDERMERAVSLLRDGNPENALRELTALEADAPPALRTPIQLNRGLALHHMRRYEDSNKVLEPLTSGPYKSAIPALYYAAKNYRIVSTAIDPIVKKTITEKKRVGTIKVKAGKGKKRKTVSKPKYANVSRTVELIDLAKKKKKEEYARLHSERLKDLLQLPLAVPVRQEVLQALIAVAEAKNQDDYILELVPQVVRLDPLADPGLQRLWDKGWAAYSKGDLPTARKHFRFIADTYTSENVKRQSEYWFARTIERQGQKEEAMAIYRKLAAAPYADLYAIHAVGRGAPRQEEKSNPLESKREDWSQIAERDMPQELRLAYELTALSNLRDARVEIQRNMRRENNRYAEALLAEIYHSTGNALLMYRSIRRAFPQLATVEQDKVPPYFIKMYYPTKYQDAIRKNAAKHGLDPHLVMGLILQESYYNPTARSRVGATGLMQIMPPTGRELAGRLRIPFAVTRLENPDVNIQLGTLHLRNLINLFGGNTYLAVASYNAGQGNVAKWRRGARGKSLDEFLESIPFSETRNYVKRVTMLRSAYSRLAG
jgi:soluble lytic murein transglycosylase-like protein/TolA-binding protein